MDYVDCEFCGQELGWILCILVRTIGEFCGLCRLWILWTRTRVNFVYTRKNYRRILWTRLWILWSRTRVNFFRVGYWLFGFFYVDCEFFASKRAKERFTCLKEQIPLLALLKRATRVDCSLHSYYKSDDSDSLFYKEWTDWLRAIALLFWA